MLIIRVWRDAGLLRATVTSTGDVSRADVVTRTTTVTTDGALDAVRAWLDGS